MGLGYGIWQAKYIPHQTAAAATGNGTPMPVTNQADGAYVVWAVQVTGTFSGTVTFEGTVDGTNWVDIEMVSLGNSTTVSTTATAAGIWRGNVVGLTEVRVRVSTYASGAITAVGQLVPIGYIQGRTTNPA
jgi:predicted secreted protein